MGSQIIKQPDGRFAIFSTFTDTIHVYNATADEIVEHFAEQAAERERLVARKLVEHVAAGNAREAYYQFTMTWEEALADDREHGGDVWAVFR